MKTFLIFAERPEHTDIQGATDAWHTFLSNTATFLPPAMNTEKLPKGLWQLPLDSGLRTLAQLLLQADKDKIRLRVLLLDEKPIWIK